MASSPSLSRRDALRRLGLIGGASVMASWSVPTALATTLTPLPRLTGAQPGFYRFPIGDFEALALVDGQLNLPVAQSPFQVEADQLQEVLRGEFLSPEQVRLAINVLLVRTPTDLILVDSGCGSLFGPVGGRLLSHLAAAGVTPQQVTLVVVTHLHGDHFGGLLDPETNQPVYPNARYVINRVEHDFWLEPDLSTSLMPPEARSQSTAAAQKVLGALKGKWERMAAGDRVVEGVTLVDAPGHTPGHVGLAFTSGGEQLVHISDVVHHHAISLRRPEWLIGFDVDPRRGAETRQRMLDRLAADRAWVFGSHLPFPGLGHIRAESGKFEYVIQPWRLG